MSKPYGYEQQTQVWQSGSNYHDSSLSSTTATVAKRSIGLGAARMVRPSSAFTNTQSSDQSKDRASSTNVPKLRERAGNRHRSGTTSGDPVHETYVGERDAKGTTNLYRNNDDQTWKDGDTRTDSTRSVHNTSHDTNTEENPLFTAGKSSDRAQVSSVSDAEPKQRYAKSLWAGSSNQYRERNTSGYDTKSLTTNVRDADKSDTHITEVERHDDYNNVSFNIHDTDDLKNTVELLRKIKTMAPLADRSLLELAALQRKDVKSDSERIQHQNEILQKELDKVIEENKSRLIAINEISEARDTALADLKDIKVELENERRKGIEHLTLLQKYKKDFETNANENKNTQDELSRKKSQYDKLLQEHNQLKTELADYKTRLSQLMGSRLSDNNPDIADLSDKNRPTKLAEKYQELYDNEWTDAYEVFEGYFKDEMRAIKNLKSVLEHVKGTCDELSTDQSAKLVESLTMRTAQRGPLSKDIIKQLKDLRRSTAESSLERVLEKYIKHVEELQASGKQLATLVLDERIRPFIKGCVQLCWLMSVQDPPLEFGTDPDPTKPIDTTAYKFYTKSGTSVEYVVWPPLYLHKEGPLLCKGILQAHSTNVQIYPPIANRDTFVAKRDATVVQAYTPEDDKSSARERRRGNFVSHRITNIGTTHNNVNPQPRVQSNASTERQTGHNDYKYQTSEKQSGPRETNRPEISSTRTLSSQTNVTSDIQIPTEDEWRIFYRLGRQYGLGSKEQKEALGDRYQACLEDYNKYIKRPK